MRGTTFKTQYNNVLKLRSGTLNEGLSNVLNGKAAALLVVTLPQIEAFSSISMNCMVLENNNNSRYFYILHRVRL